MLNKIKLLVSSSLKSLRATSVANSNALLPSTADPRLRNLYAAAKRHYKLCGIFLAAVAFSACAAAAPSIRARLRPGCWVCTEWNILLFLDHHDLMFFIIVIVVFVSWMLGRFLYFYRAENTATPRVAFAQHTLLEKIWTFIPAVILVLIAAPSVSLLYSIDASIVPKISVKVIGQQCYWSYETTDMITSKDINIDSYRLLEADLPKGALRLLEVDNRLVLPTHADIGPNIADTAPTPPNMRSKTAVDLWADKYRAGYTNLQFVPRGAGCCIVPVPRIPQIHPFADLGFGFGHQHGRMGYFDEASRDSASAPS